MPQHIRLYYRDPMNGRVPCNLNWAAITSNSVVNVTACEYVPDRSDPNGGFAGSDRKRFIGSADVWVTNIAPHGSPWDPNQGVGWVVHVAWDEPIYICVDITVYDEGPVEIQT
ncbi:hypothetical protein ABZX85_16270 [Streptomyces sp. NPDC004539]|uniref:hypothetical protein n=1 Tax=Streptomyces sp. NPDC004539 TaxID=3154280 RepID=UPI0033BA5774